VNALVVRLVVLVPLVARVHLVEVPGLARAVLVLPAVARPRHLGLEVEQLLLLVEPLADRRLVDRLVLARGAVALRARGAARLDDEPRLGDSAPRRVQLVAVRLVVDDLAQAVLLGDALEERRLPLGVPRLGGDGRCGGLARLLGLVVLDVHLVVVVVLVGTGVGRRRGERERVLDLLGVAERLVALLLAQLLEAVEEDDLVHVAQLGLGLPHDELLEEALPVLDVDDLAARELALDLLLQLHELVERLAAQQALDLGLDGRVGPALGRVGIDADGALLAQGLERRRRDDEERAPELGVRVDLLELQVHLDVVVELLGVLEREVLRAGVRSVSFACGEMSSKRKRGRGRTSKMA